MKILISIYNFACCAGAYFLRNIVTDYKKNATHKIHIISNQVQEIKFYFIFNKKVVVQSKFENKNNRNLVGILFVFPPIQYHNALQ